MPQIPTEGMTQTLRKYVVLDADEQDYQNPIDYALDSILCDDTHETFSVAREWAVRLKEDYPEGTFWAVEVETTTTFKLVTKVGK